jgi:two-component system chemotaxis sensor kinase CheA
MRYNPIETFLQEAEELLSEIEEGALLLGGEEGTDETINQLFRAFHTIKGSGAMFGFDVVAEFTHHIENLLDSIREGVVPVSPNLADLVLKAKDHIKVLLGSEEPRALQASSETLICAIEEFAHSGRQEDQRNTISVLDRTEHGKGNTEPTWQISFRPDPALLTCGGSPVALLKELQKLGSCEIIVHTEEVPLLDEIRPDLCYFWWTITLRGSCDENAIRDVFIFVEEDSKLEITLLENQSPKEPGEPQPLNRSESVDLVNSGTAAVAAPQRALVKESTVRVPANRLDRLVDLVGELVMNQSRLAQAAAQRGAPEFVNPVQELERLVAELRDNVLGIRMLPIGTLFGRFQRLVHDLSAELGKEVELVTEGAETELDKSILDQLGEPLVHCLRNCLDHGIEPPEERLEKGKPRCGTVRLSAVHTGSDVVVSIRDDGRGINRAAVRAKAIEKKLIAPDASLSDKEILNLILLPGFSTAKQLTSVSGRGVGMDAVKREIDALRGSLSLASEEDKGTRLSITLPLTLAIIEGLLVQIGCDQFIVPMAAVTENVELLRVERTGKNRRNVIAVRGELIPYIDLRQTFHIEGDAPEIEKVVIVRHEDQRVGLVVDRVLGTHQTVIQSLGKFLRNINVVSGATIMGDGRVALIMDIAAVVRYVDGEGQDEATKTWIAEPMLVC